MNGLKKRIYLKPRDSKKDRLLSITFVPIFVLHLLLLLIMMSYLRPTPHLKESIKIKNKNSTQTKRR